MRNLVRAERAKKFEQSLFTEKDLRGLSKPEKEFIRENNYHVYYQQKDTTYKHFDKIILFVARDKTTNKKRLYGLTKWQLINPNLCDTAWGQKSWNYQYWLVPVLSKALPFSPYSYEFRFSESASVTYPYSI